jgi:hypothetical protein
MKLPIVLLEDSAIDPRWMTGPFANLKSLSAKTKGKRFEEIAHYILNSKNFIVDIPENSDHDRVVNGSKFEIKGSTVTKGSDDCFSFLQIRPDQDYDTLLLETFWFDGTIKFFKLDKYVVMEMIQSGLFKKQHGGNKADSRTFCYNGTMKPFEQYFFFEVKIV